jgi:hypothetical protein
MAFSLNKSAVLQKTPTKLKPEIKYILSNMPDSSRIFGDDAWNKLPRTMFKIKVSPDNLKTVPGYKRNLDKVVVEYEGYKVQFIASGLKSASATKASGATATAMQERGSAWILKRALNDNIKYNKWEDIANDPNYSELEKIYPDIDDDWLKTFYKQQRTMLKELSGRNYTEFNRDGGFMYYITKLVQQKFEISQKDTWNPADIWAIRDEAKVIKMIEDNVAGSKASQTIQELNSLLRSLFTARSPKPGVVGISLKKISGPVALWEVYNLKGFDKLNVRNNYSYASAEAKLDLTNSKDVIPVYSHIYVSAPNSKYVIEMGRTSAAGFTNLKYEVTDKSASAARAGKAPVAFVKDLMAFHDMKFVNNHNLYPKSWEDFSKRKTEFLSIFATLKRQGVVLKVNNQQEFLDNIRRAFEDSPNTATSKLMAMDFISQVNALKLIPREEFLTDIIFLAKKKGKTFGPFGKLY